MPGQHSGRAQPGRAHRIRRYRSLLWHYATRFLSRPAPVEGEIPDAPPPGSVAIALGGHSTFVLRYSRATVVTDPMLRTRYRGVRRAQMPAFSAADLAGCDVVLLSGLGPLQCHLPTLQRIAPRAIIGPLGARQRIGALGALGDRVHELAPGEERIVAGVQVVGCGVGGGRRSVRKVSFCIRGDGPAVYYLGESPYFEAIAAIGSRRRPDIALLPISGYSPRAMQRYHMSPDAAVDAFYALGARALVPHRAGAFALSYERLGDPLSWLATRVAHDNLDTYVHVLSVGETKVFRERTRARARQQTVAPDLPRAAPGEGGAHPAGKSEGRRERGRPTAEIVPAPSERRRGRHVRDSNAAESGDQHDR